MHDWSFAGGERSKVLWSPKIWTLQFLEENSGSTFYHATTYDQARIIYSPEKEKGIWFLAGGGDGSLPVTGLRIRKEIVAK